MPQTRRRIGASASAVTAQDDLAQVRERLAEVVHDLHTPLAALSLLAPADSPERETLSGHHDQLRRAVTALRRQAQVLRDHPLFRLHPLRLAPTSCAPVPWLERLRPTLEEIARGRGMDLAWDCRSLETSLLPLDRHRLGAAVEHLLVHRAWRASRMGVLWLWARWQGGTFDLRIGGDEESDRDPSTAGRSGLAGIEYARSVIEAHGGSLREVQLDGTKREWRVRLEGRLEDPAIGAVSITPRGRPSRVLVVEDDGALRELLADLLSIHFEVRTAGDGVETLKLLESFSPDLLVIDRGLPDIDGLRLIRQIRDEVGMVVPVLLVTGSPHADDLGGLDRGLILPKPFRGTDLLSRASRLLEPPATGAEGGGGLVQGAG